MGEGSGVGASRSIHQVALQGVAIQLDAQARLLRRRNLAISQTSRLYSLRLESVQFVLY